MRESSGSPPGSGTLYVCSGGDDQAACLALYEVVWRHGQAGHILEMGLTAKAIVRQDGVSYSAIRSTHLFSSGEEDPGGLGVITVGCDQRLVVWRVIVDNEGGRSQQKAPFSCDVEKGESLESTPVTLGMFMRWCGREGSSIVEVCDVMGMDALALPGMGMLALVCGDGIGVLSVNQQM